MGKFIDNEWRIRFDDHLGNKIFHLCKGDLSKDFTRRKGKHAPKTGFWPINKKEWKCSACGKEVPNHVKLHVT